MPRDIRIIPNYGATATNQFPRIDFSGPTTSTISLKVDDDGSVVYTGTYGVLFNITDNKDGLLHSVNDISGLPILQVYSYDYVQLGKWDKYTLVANSDKVGIGLTSPSGILHITNNGASFSQFRITGSASQTNPLTIWENGSGTVSYIEPNGDFIFFDSGSHTIKSADKSNATTGNVYIKTGDTSGIGICGDLYIQGGYDGTDYGKLYLNTSGGTVDIGGGSNLVTLNAPLAFSHADVSGTIQLSSGQATVANTNITGTSRIFLSYDGVSGTITGRTGNLAAESISAGNSFVITSYDSGAAIETGDNNYVFWFVII